MVGAARSGPGEAPGAVDAPVAGEVRGNGGGADVFAACKPGHRRFVEPEAPEIVGEVENAAWRQPGDRGAQQVHVRGLDVEVPCPLGVDRKSTRLNSSHVEISYAVFCLKKKISRTPRLALAP